MSTTLKYWLAILVLATGAYASLVLFRQPGETESDSHPQSFSRPQFHQPQESPYEFEFVDQEGGRFDMHSLKGKVWVGSFFYTACPSECIRLNATIEQIMPELADMDVTFVSFTCDPEDDTPEVLKKYADHFHADTNRWRFLTGEVAALRRMALNVMEAAMAIRSHSDRCVVFDGEGNIHGAYRVIGSQAEVERLKKLIRKLVVKENSSGSPSADQASEPDESNAESILPVATAHP